MNHSCTKMPHFYSHGSLLVLFCFVLSPPGTWSFVLTHRNTGLGHVSVRTMAPSTSRDAKRKKKKAPASKGRTGGFGRVSEAKNPNTVDDGDYSVFPSLDQNVKETLVPWIGETAEDASGELPPEITDRLAQIYGFRHFNYASTEEEDNNETSDSFGDLLASSNANTNKSEFDDILKPSTGGDDSFADLLATATGGSSDSGSASAPTTAIAQNLPLSSLEPFSKFRVLHVDPLVIAIDDFMSEDICNKYVAMSEAPPSPKSEGPMQIRSRTVGKDHAAKSQRTSTTWFHHYKGVPELMAKASRLLGLNDINCWEEPQTVR